jgi:hypothetical protein
VRVLASDLIHSSRLKWIVRTDPSAQRRSIVHAEDERSSHFGPARLGVMFGFGLITLAMIVVLAFALR